MSSEVSKVMKPLKIDDLLQRNVYDVDHRPHIIPDTDKCSKCKEKLCVLFCPAGCYTIVDRKLVFSYEGCLECGTCRIVCPQGGLRWSYPRSGRGVLYRFS